MDIHLLTSEQWDELFKDLLALKNAVLIEESYFLEEEEDFA